MSYRLAHNGYNVSYHNDLNEVKARIEEVLNNYNNIKPEKIVDDFETILPDGKPEIWFIVYRYRTLFDECFMVEKL